MSRTSRRPRWGRFQLATASELIADVRRLIQDDSYSDETILGFLNDGITEIAAWDNNNPELGLVGSILLPALETRDTVATSTTDSFVELPEDYMRNLYKVTFEGQTAEVHILSNMRVLLDEWDNDLTRTGGGPVEDVTVMGNYLHYQPIPVVATELTLWYYALPTLLSRYDPGGDDTDDTPSAIPAIFQKSLLVNYAAKEIFNEIEDGIESRKVNTERYEAKYQQALSMLYRSIKHKSKQIPYVRRHANFF
jgi:hypothetical protein